MEQASRVPGAQVAFRTLLERALRRRGGRVELRAEELARVHQPVLFIWAEHDTFASPDWGRRACARRPNARLEVLTGGHCPWTDHPQRCAERVSAFLEPADASARSPLTADEPVPGAVPIGTRSRPELTAFRTRSSRTPPGVCCR